MKKLYHITYKSLVPEIKREGIGGHKPEWAEHPEGITYLTTNPEEDVNEVARNPQGGEKVALEINIKSLDKSKLAKKNGDIIYKGVIPASAIVDVEKLNESMADRPGYVAQEAFEEDVYEELKNYIDDYDTVMELISLYQNEIAEKSIEAHHSPSAASQIAQWIASQEGFINESKSKTKKKLNEMPRKMDSDEVMMDSVATALAEQGIEDYAEIEELLNKYSDEIYSNMVDAQHDPNTATRVAKWIIGQEQGGNTSMYSESMFNKLFVNLDD